MRDNWHAKGPIVVWQNYYTEGWKPRSYATVKDALFAPDGFSSDFVITRVVEIDVVEKEPSDAAPEAR